MLLIKLFAKIVELNKLQQLFVGLREKKRDTLIPKIASSLKKIKNKKAYINKGTLKCNIMV